MAWRRTSHSIISLALSRRNFSSSRMSASISAFGRVPVFGGKGIEREELDAGFLAGFDAFADGLGAGAVAGDARQAAVLGPAAVAIHDDGDVAWRARGCGHGGGRGRAGNRARHWKISRGRVFARGRGRHRRFSRACRPVPRCGRGRRAPRREDHRRCGTVVVSHLQPGRDS